MSQDPGPLPPYEAFDELSRLVVSDHSLDSVMTAIAEVGKRLLPTAAEVSVTLVRDGVAETVATTGPLAVAMDERQYDDGAGPCLVAAAHGELVQVRDAPGDERWPQFAAAARAHGVGSSLSVPVQLPHPVSAGLNLYSADPGGFAEHDVELVRTLAAYAAVALSNLHLYESQKRVSEHLERALDSRGVIEQAKGILMGQQRCTADQAFELLVVASQRSNRRLRDIAQELVDKTGGG